MGSRDRTEGRSLLETERERERGTESVRASRTRERIKGRTWLSEVRNGESEGVGNDARCGGFLFNEDSVVQVDEEGGEGWRMLVASDFGRRGERQSWGR